MPTRMEKDGVVKDVPDRVGAGTLGHPVEVHLRRGWKVVDDAAPAKPAAKKKASSKKKAAEPPPPPPPPAAEEAPPEGT